MRNVVLMTLLMSWIQASAALTTQPFKENADVEIVLSNQNYNRLVVRHDKILQAHFPEGALAFELSRHKGEADWEQEGEADGSMYVMAANPEPFTLFITTQSGRHFSATIKSDASLGQTVEFIPETKAPQVASPALKTPKKEVITPLASPIKALMSQMISNQKPQGFDTKRHFGRVIRLQQGLMLTPKVTYNGLELSGEVLELYNGGRQALDINESWFAAEGVKAISLSQATLAPKQTARLYRVTERAHG